MGILPRMLRFQSYLFFFMSLIILQGNGKSFLVETRDKLEPNHNGKKDSYTGTNVKEPGDDYGDEEEDINEGEYEDEEEYTSGSQDENMDYGRHWLPCKTFNNKRPCITAKPCVFCGNRRTTTTKRTTWIYPCPDNNCGVRPTVCDTCKPVNKIITSINDGGSVINVQGGHGIDNGSGGDP